MPPVPERDVFNVIESTVDVVRHCARQVALDGGHWSGGVNLVVVRRTRRRGWRTRVLHVLRVDGVQGGRELVHHGVEVGHGGVGDDGGRARLRPDDGIHALVQITGLLGVFFAHVSPKK